MSARGCMRKSTRKRIQHHRDDVRRTERVVVRVLRQFRVDKSGIPADKLNDPRLLDTEASINQKLAAESYRLQSCLHEVAHAIYFERVGVEWTLCGPAILYGDDDFKIQYSGVDPTAEFVTKGGPIDPKNVIQLRQWARAVAAGGVVERRLTNTDDGRDVFDKENFFSNEIFKDTTRTEIQKLWDQAQEDVENDLKSPAFRQQLWDRARELKREFDSKYKYVETPAEYFVATFDANDTQRVLNVVVEREAA